MSAAKHPNHNHNQIELDPKEQEKKRIEKIIFRWRLVVGAAFLFFIISAAYGVVKLLNWLIAYFNG